jgi:hypothetical protein
MLVTSMLLVNSLYNLLKPLADILMDQTKAGFHMSGPSFALTVMTINTPMRIDSSVVTSLISSRVTRW